MLALVCLGAQPASAQSAPPASDVNPGRHRVAAALGGFQLVKDEYAGVAFGVGYGYRPVSGVELGAGFRYLVRPARTTDSLVSQPMPSPGAEPLAPEYHVEPAFHMWVLSAPVRGYLSLDAGARLELGLTARPGILGHDERVVCCVEFALGPDFRARILPSTAVALSPQLAIGTTGADQSGYHVESLFGYAAVWLSVIQTF
jgi:hypothetical protein